MLKLELLQVMLPGSEAQRQNKNTCINTGDTSVHEENESCKIPPQYRTRAPRLQNTYPVWPVSQLTPGSES